MKLSLDPWRGTSLHSCSVYTALPSDSRCAFSQPGNWAGRALVCPSRVLLETRRNINGAPSREGHRNPLLAFPLEVSDASRELLTERSQDEQLQKRKS